MKKHYKLEDLNDISIDEIHDLYKKYISKSQVDLISSFKFGNEIPSHAEGIKIFTDKREVYDFTGGIGVLNHGHNHPRILKARKNYNDLKKMEVHKNYLSKWTAALSCNIANLLPNDLNISYFPNSGSEAVEGAIKMAYKYHNGERDIILHSDISFHGKLLGAGSLTNSPEINFSFQKILNKDTFKFNDLNSVKSLIEKYKKKDGSSNIYSIIVEPFSASSLLECDESFLVELSNICRKENIVLIFDEVYTGWAKSGTLFYFMRYQNLLPDILVYAKSLGGGKSSIAGYTARENIYRNAYDNLDDATLHSTTYYGFGEETITAIEAINIIIEENYCEKALKIEKILNESLNEIKIKFPNQINEIRGKGALFGMIVNPGMIGDVMNFILPKIPGRFKSKTNFGNKIIIGSVISHLYNNYNILSYFGSNVNLPLKVTPPLIASEKDILYYISSLEKTLKKGIPNLVLDFVSQKYIS